MIKPRTTKDGAALVIALGFLAILTVMILAFAAQSRTERLSGRSYLNNTQARQLLQTALSRAMEDIEFTYGTAYPERFALGSVGDTEVPILGSVDLSTELDYLPLGNQEIAEAFDSEQSIASWDHVTVDGEKVGRIAYIIVNTSGLLDANAVGGLDAGGTLRERDSGLSPQEIQLSRTFVPELKESGSLVDSDGTKTDSSDPNFTFVHNRDTAWHRFETLRDLIMLNNAARGDVIDDPVESFSTFSYSLSGSDPRTFMGTNSATLNREFITSELEQNSAVNADFVLNQLADYLDTDTFPEDEDGNYTDESVEPVPLINELILTCNFSFIPQMIRNDEGILIMEALAVTNNYYLEVEAWYPFTGYENSDSFGVQINATPIESGALPDTLFSNVTQWVGGSLLPEDIGTPGSDPFNLNIHGGVVGTEVTTEAELLALFEEMESDIQFPSIACSNATGSALVDQVLNLELPLSVVVPSDLQPVIEDVADFYFATNTISESTSNRFVVAMSCVDPRLNWDGESSEQWQDDVSAGFGATAGTPGEINTDVFDEVSTADVIGTAYVRNTDRIDSPWEFTYLLYDTSKPWNTFQMLEDNDPDETRQILQNLSPFPDRPPAAGRINPYTPHTNTIASLFMDMPTREFESESNGRLNEAEAIKAAEIFMQHIRRGNWSTDASEISSGINSADLSALTSSENPWIQEGFFRNSYELFNPRDSLYAVLLVAQSGTDTDEDGLISDDEVRSTEQAVVYVWRDIPTGKAAVSFFGLTDTLRSSIGSGQSWGELLSAFQP